MRDSWLAIMQNIGKKNIFISGGSMVSKKGAGDFPWDSLTIWERH